MWQAWGEQKYRVKEKGKVNSITGHEGPEGEFRYICTLDLTSALDGGGWSTPRSVRFNPGKVVFHGIGGWVGPRVGLERCGK